MSNDGQYRVYPSLQQALTARQIPVENHALIRRFCEHLGITRFEERVGYIKAVRPDDGPALEIHHGYTNGFRNETEARDAVGDHGSGLPLVAWRHRQFGGGDGTVVSEVR